MSETKRERISFCRYLRTKKMYIPAYHLQGDPREGSDTAQFWCLRTHNGIGPDNDLVLGEECRQGRSCCETDF